MADKISREVSAFQCEDALLLANQTNGPYTTGMVSHIWNIPLMYEPGKQVSSQRLR